jgi:xylulokinase
MGVEIKIYNTTGAIGAARACALVDRDTTKFSLLIEENDYKMTYLPKDNKEVFESAYVLWKKRLEQKLKE